MTLKQKMDEMKQDEARQAGVAANVPVVPTEVTDADADEQAPNAQPADAETQTPVNDPDASVATASDTVHADAKLQAENETLRQENSRLVEANKYLQHRWETFAGMHKSQVTSVAQENEAMKTRIVDLEKQLASVPRSSIVEETLKKRFGDTWDRMDDETKQMWMKQEEAHQADISALRSTVTPTRKLETNERAEKLWNKVEALKPGFRSAMQNEITGLPVFLDDQNDESANGMTYRQCIDEAVKAGRAQEIIEIADKFTSLTGHTFDANGETQVITPRPQSAMPAATLSGQAPRTTNQPTVTEKPRFPKAFANALFRVVIDMETDMRRGKKFRPLSVAVGKFTRSFKTVAEMRKLMSDVEDAEMNDRLD